MASWCLVRLPEAIDFLIRRGVPKPTAERLGQYMTEWGIDLVGTGNTRQYEHEFLEAMATYWHPLIRQNGYTKIGQAMRRKMRDFVRTLPCAPAVVWITRGTVSLIDEADICLDTFRDGAVLIPIHQDCPPVALEHDAVGVGRT
jgi:hypothetical protein